MIIVRGTAQINSNDLTKALHVSLEHVHRSRKEPGCIKHTLQQNSEDPNQLVFYEEWTDLSDLMRHFEVPESKAFIGSLGELSVSEPKMKIYKAKEVKI